MAVRRRLTVAVLGSARLGLDDPEWEVAVAVGRGLVEAGCAVMTGGYGGLMSATASGAHGGVVIGLPMRAWTTLTPDPDCTELRWSDSYPERLAALLSCDAVIAGVGSSAVRAAIERYQPMLGLHGHIHESRGEARIGRTVSLNPGSEYGEGVLRGVLVTLSEKKGLRGWQFVAG